MAKATFRLPRIARPELDGSAVLNALPHPVVVVDAADIVAQVNLAAQTFFDCSAHHLCGHPLADHLAPDSPLFSVVDQARANGGSISEDGVTLDSPRIGGRLVGLQVASIPEAPGHVVISIHERTIAHKLGRQLDHRSAARSVVAMAAMLAHEVKNPLSGIRGAAQLLDDNVISADDRQLTRLIVDEADRICALVDRMEAFSDARPLDRGAVNIHQVLDHVRRVAQNGFARRVRFTERYDPSLPPVLGSRDQLVQVVLNLVKNAPEPVPAAAPHIFLPPPYQPPL